MSSEETKTYDPPGIFVNNCMHWYHNKCIKPWAAGKRHPTCPECRADLVFDQNDGRKAQLEEYSEEFDEDGLPPLDLGNPSTVRVSDEEMARRRQSRRARTRRRRANLDPNELRRYREEIGEDYGRRMPRRRRRTAEELEQELEDDFKKDLKHLQEESVEIYGKNIVNVR